MEALEKRRRRELDELNGAIKIVVAW